MATRQAFTELVDLALEEEVAFVLIAGDIYDGDWKDFSTGFFYISQIQRLNQKGIRVFQISGNHDAQSIMTKDLPLPKLTKQFSTRKPETEIIEDLKVAIHGQGFATKSVQENLAENFPHSQSGYFNIGLLHTSLVGGYQGHDNYAPCSLEDLKSKGYDYWALGHIHKREELCQDPWVVFPGNIQGRHIHESGPKGCTLIEVDQQSIIKIEHHDLDQIRWQTLQVKLDQVNSLEEAVDRFSEACQSYLKDAPAIPYALRVELIGETPFHSKLNALQSTLENFIRINASEVSDGAIWIEKVRLNTHPPKKELSTDPETPTGQIQLLLKEILNSPEELEAIKAELSPLLKKIDVELKKVPDHQDWPSEEDLKLYLDRAHDYLLHELKEASNSSGEAS